MSGGILVLLLPIALTAGEVKLGIGGQAWYVQWEPFWKRDSHYRNSWGGFIRSTMLFARSIESVRVRPTPFYGPMISLSLPAHFRLATSFMYGRWEGEGTGRGIFVTYGYVGKKKYQIYRYDSDSMLSYTIYPWLNVFLGFKYSHYDYSIRERIVQSPPSGSASSYLLYEYTTKNYNEYAPGLGVGFIAPLKKRHLYLLATVSAVYSLSDYRATNTSTMMQTPALIAAPPLAIPVRGVINRLGLNAVLTLAWYIAPLRTTLTAGVRYQVYKLLNTDTSETARKQTRLWDQYYGFTASATCTIDLSRQPVTAE